MKGLQRVGRDWLCATASSTRTRKHQVKHPVAGGRIKRNKRRLVPAVVVQLRNSLLQDGLYSI